MDGWRESIRLCCTLMDVGIGTLNSPFSRYFPSPIWDTFIVTFPRLIFPSPIPSSFLLQAAKATETSPWCLLSRRLYSYCRGGGFAALSILLSLFVGIILLISSPGEYYTQRKWIYPQSAFTTLSLISSVKSVSTTRAKVPQKPKRKNAINQDQREREDKGGKEKKFLKENFGKCGRTG